MSQPGQALPTVRIVSWNVNDLSARTEDKFAAITELLNSVEILALQETHLQEGNNEAFGNPDFVKWQYDREPVIACKKKGGGLMVYLKDTIQSKLAGQRQIFRDVEENGSKRDPLPRDNLKAGLQYLHFEITKPILFDLVVVYNPSGYNQHIIELAQFFYDDLEIRNIVFVGDFNVSHLKDGLLDDVPSSFNFFIAENTCFKDVAKPSHTDHIMSDLPRKKEGENWLSISSARVQRPVDESLSDHIMVSCIINPPGNQRDRHFFQPTWDSPTESQNICVETWVSNRTNGFCVLAFFFTFFDSVNNASLATQSVNVYADRTEKETICVGYTQGATVKGLLKSFQAVFKELRKSKTPIISQRCALVHIANENDLKTVFANRQLTSRFEKYASRYPTCEARDTKCYKIFRTDAERLKHEKSVHKRSLFECRNNDCGLRFDNKSLLEKHKNRYHNGGKSCAFRLCHKNLEQENYERHALLFHCKFFCQDQQCLGVKIKHEQNFHFCEACPKSSRNFHASQMHLQQHMKAVHNRPLPRPDLVCPKCDKIHKKEGWYHRHLIACLDEKPYQCEKCKRQYELEGWFLKHPKSCKATNDSACNNCGRLATFGKSTESSSKTQETAKNNICKCCGCVSEVRDQIESDFEKFNASKSGIIDKIEKFANVNPMCAVKA